MKWLGNGKTANTELFDIYRSKGIHGWQAQDQGSNHVGHEARQRFQGR